MSLMSLYESKARQLRRELERHRARQASEETKAAQADAAANRYAAEAGRSTSQTTARSKARQAEGKRSEAIRARETASKALTAAASTQKKLHDAEERLRTEQEREDRQRRQKEQRDRDHADREQKQRERVQQRETAELRDRTQRLEQHLRAMAPEKITVLFIAASPEDQEPLRLDREVREIQQRLRASEYRDSVHFEVRPATQVQDLLQILAEVKPHVVHFSGHGSQAALVFEDVDGNTKTLSNELLAGLLRTSSDRIRLAVFNSCESSGQAALACTHIHAAIGMSTPIADEAAKVFAGQFYNALGFGRTLQTAFDQACLQVEMLTGELSGAPELHTAKGIDPADVLLVAPQEERDQAQGPPAGT